MVPASGLRYTAVAIALHWAMAALLVFMIWLGWNMDDNEARYQLHKSIGVTLLFLTLARIGWRLVNPPPALPDGLKPLEARLAGAAQAGFYILMLVLPLSGWLLVSISPFQVATVLYGLADWPHLPFTEPLRQDGAALFRAVVENIHSKGAWVLIILLGLHIAGALRHEISPGGGVLRRMIPTPGRRPDKPARGLLIVFLPVLGLFFGITALAGAGQASAPAPEAVPLEAGQWRVDHSVSEIRFRGLHDGATFEGIFEEWDAVIFFSPDNLAEASALVRVRTGSARTGTRLYDSTLREAEWFNTAAFPEARIVLENFTQAPDGGYSAEARLTLKETEVRVPLQFTLTFEKDLARLQGAARLSRQALGLGQISDPAAAWVGDEIEVLVSGEARRID